MKNKSFKRVKKSDIINSMDNLNILFSWSASFFGGLKEFGGIQNIKFAQWGTDVNTLEVWIRDMDKVQDGYLFVKDSSYPRVIVRCKDFRDAIDMADLINDGVRASEI